MKTDKSLFLGIETSCDDTSVALVFEDGEVLDIQKFTKDEDHRPFGGILPERASRNHLRSLIPLLEKILTDNDKSLKDIEALSTTTRPGLMGSLLVGSIAAKTLSQVIDKPFLSVNHLVGHLYSPWLYQPSKKEKPSDLIFPHICLIVSGGHTQLVLVEEYGSHKVIGRTRDDAVGESLDKFSKLIGLGFPGGPLVDKKSKEGDPKAFKFPRPLLKENNYDFSYSGLKASAARMIESFPKQKWEEENLLENLCASYLEASMEVLMCKLERAIDEFQPKLFTIVGGVSANSLLRKKALELSEKKGLSYKIPRLDYCTDNGAMIALAGALKWQHTNSKSESFSQSLNESPSARSFPGDFI